MHGNVSSPPLGFWSVFCYRTNCRNVAELHDLSPKSAIHYRFRPAPGADSRGPTDALRELKAIGCTLATQEWVDNHWSLILWKLAGMVALDPESEVDEDHGMRWSWKETLRQLRYRYVFLVLES